jgi:DinB superfamily
MRDASAARHSAEPHYDSSMSIYANPAGVPANSYVEAMLALVGDRDPLAMLPHGPSGVMSAIAGLADAQLRKPEREGKWSIIEVIQHMADAELVTAFRLRMIVAHDRPAISGYDQDLWSRNLRYAAAGLEETLDQLRLLRSINLRLVNSLSTEERNRVGIHAERGPESVNRLMTMMAAHDIVHTRQIERIRAAVA